MKTTIKGGRAYGVQSSDRAYRICFPCASGAEPCRVTPLIPNEDVIDLFDRVKPGATVVALASGRSAWMGPIAGPRKCQFDMVEVS